MRSLKLRYSLRTFLIVIALVACFLGYHLRIKSQRQALLAQIIASGGGVITYDAFHEQMRNALSGNALLNPLPRDILWSEEKQQQISWIRSWLGDTPIVFIHDAKESLSAAEFDQVCELFPEAVVSKRIFPESDPNQ